MPELSDPVSTPAEPIPAGPIPAGTPAGPIPAGPIPAGPIPAGTIPAGTTDGPLRPNGKGTQWAFAPRASVPVRVGMALFAIGVLAIVVIMGMFASGSHDLPLWLNLTAMLAPLGFAVGMAGVAVDARRSSRALARATASQESDAGPQP